MSEAFDRFVETVAKLRGENGCPWDKKQTHGSLKPYFVEETYEALQAIDDGEDQSLKDELGDVLLQIGLHAQIAAERGAFGINDVCRSITEKLIRRHPHVFGDVAVDGVDDVLDNWHAIKKREKGEQPLESAIQGVPQSLPALMLAMQVSRKAARAGFEWPDMQGVIEKMREEIAELEEAIREDRPEDIEAEIGDLLFTIVNIARWSGVDAEQALRTMVGRFRARFMAMEDRARTSGMALEEMTPEDWDRNWNLVKQDERPGQ